MGMPSNRKEWCESLLDFAGLTIMRHLRENFKDTAEILDVGAGWGKYAMLLPRFRNIDGCEAWPMNAQPQLYRELFITDVCELDLKPYDAIIMGDVFEHISREQMKELLPKLLDSCQEIYVAIPYQYEQEAVDGNPYEEHLQADLTPELMAQEYPQLKLLNTDGMKGVYVKWRELDL